MIEFNMEACLCGYKHKRVRIARGCRRAYPGGGLIHLSARRGDLPCFRWMSRNQAECG